MSSRIEAAFAGGLLGLALVAGAGCGGGSHAPAVANLGTTTRSSGSTPTSAVPWANCMNAHGIHASAAPHGYISVPPDVDKNSTQFQAAQAACRRLLPLVDQGGGGPRSTPREGAKMLKFSRCMRKHGVPSFPDPTFVNGLWTPGDMAPGSGIDASSPKFEAAQSICQRIAPFGKRSRR
jgi:hypothetical protein